MSKRLEDNIKVHISKDVDEIFDIMRESKLLLHDYPEREFPYPYHRDLLRLLQTVNPLELSYYYIEEIDIGTEEENSIGGNQQQSLNRIDQQKKVHGKYAFFTIYLNRMDLLTYGKAQWFMNVQTIGFPCSLSVPGYVTNDLTWMLDYIKTIKGCKLILNVDQKVEARGMAFGETLPTCKLTLRPEHTSLEHYMQSLRSPYRRRMNLAIKRCSDITIRRIPQCNTIIDEQIRQADEDITSQMQAGCLDIYPLYLQTYEKSDYKLECLEQEFFDQVDGEKLVFLRGETPVGFVLLKVNGTELIFMFCGMEYHYHSLSDNNTGDKEQDERQDKRQEKEQEFDCNADLYYYMLLQIVDYAIAHHCQTIDFGQTSEKTKLKFGAVLEKKYFYAHHTNPFLNLVALLGKHILEYTYEFPEFRVFKDGE